MIDTQQATARSGAGEVLALTHGKVHVRQIGEGEPLLLINGLGAHTGMWQPLEKRLEGFRIVEFDLPGAGQSPVPRRPIGISGLAAMTVELLDHFAMPRADVLGYSMGGMVAQKLTPRYPARVRRLVLAATTPGMGAVQVSPVALINILTPARYLSEHVYARTIGSMVGGRARHDPQWVSEQAALRLEHRPSWRGYLGQLRSMRGWSSLPFLSKIEAPTLVLAGGDDPLAPPINGQIIAYKVPGARILVLEGEGHLLMIDDQGKAHAAVRDFLTAPDLATSRTWSDAVPVSAADVRKGLARVPLQLPPLSVFDARARRRWLRLDRPTAP